MEGFSDEGPSGLGLVVKRVSLDGKWGKGPLIGQTLEGTELRPVAGSRSWERGWDIWGELCSAGVFLQAEYWLFRVFFCIGSAAGWDS